MIVNIEKFLMNKLNTKNNFINITYNILSISCNAIVCIIITLLYDNTHNKIYLKTLITCLTLMFFIKSTIKRHRPYSKYTHISNNDIIKTHPHYSFPSIHTMCSIIISLIIKSKMTTKIPICIVLPTLIILSRIGLGVHYLSDCLFSLVMTYTVKFVFYYL